MDVVIGPVGLLFVLVVIAAWAALWRTGVSLAPVTGRELRSMGLRDDEPAQILVSRWRDRARRWRTFGGMPLATVVVVLGVVTRSQLRIGIGDVPLWADPLVMGLLGAFAGAIGAELHHLWRRPTGPRTVSLQPRELASYLPGRSRARLTAVAAAATASTLLFVGIPATAGPPVPGLLALVVALVVLAVHRAIVTRPRPALPEDLAAADDVVRGLAIRSVEASGSGAILLLTLWQLSAVAEALLEGKGPAAVLTGLGFLAGFVVAILWWREGGPARLLGAAGEGAAREEAAR